MTFLTIGNIYYKNKKRKMAKEKSLVEEAIIQMKNLEEAVAENAKGILASTMKEEISDLVKESLSEQDDEEVVAPDAEMAAVADMDADNEDLGDEDMDDEEMDDEDMDDEDMDDEDMVDVDMDDDTIDLTDQPSSEVLKVFQLLGPEDQIVVTKDPNGNINLKDNETNKEYMIVGESDEDLLKLSEPMEYSSLDDDMNEEEDVDDIIKELFGDDDDDTSDFEGYGGLDEDEDSLYEDEDGYYSEQAVREDEDSLYEDEDSLYEDEDSLYEDEDSLYEDEDGIIYELELGDDSMMGDAGVDQLSEYSELDEYGSEFDDQMRFASDRGLDTSDWDDLSGYDDEDEEDYKEVSFNNRRGEDLSESKKKARKAVGMGMGKPKFSYDNKPNQDLPTKKQKHGGRGIGFGSAKKASKFDAKKDNGQMDGEFRVKPKKVETKEAARTYGNGSKSGRGLRKGITPNRNLTFESTNAREVQILREKNEEYRKALNIFRNKLNEVAVFNSNLAYATRLFTEHSTSKQEKINILRRFDSVETIKESKNLYHSIKDELSTDKNQSINESFERTVERAPSTGSAVNLIESKTYENPQFLRMKDLMSKLR
jgi:hypothetical protein